MDKYSILDDLFESYKLFLATQPKKNRARDLILKHYKELITAEIERLAKTNESTVDDDEAVIDDEDDH